MSGQCPPEIGTMCGTMCGTMSGKCPPELELELESESELEIEIESKKKKDSASVNLPHGNFFATAWSDYLIHRKEIKKPIKPGTRAEAAALAKCASMSEQESIDMIKASIENGWQGLFVPSRKNTTRSDAYKKSHEIMAIMPEPDEYFKNNAGVK